LYGATVLGIYATVLAFATVATLAADNGLQIATVREVNSRSDQVNKVVTTLYAVKLLLLVPAIGILAVIFKARDFTPIAWVIAGFVVARTALQSFGQLQMSILKALDRMVPIGVIQAVHSTFLLTCICTVYYFQLPLNLLLLTLVSGQTLELLLSLGFIRKAAVGASKISFSDCRSLLRRSTPVGLAYGMAGLILRMDVIVLSALASVDVVGHFAAAHMILTFAYVVAWLFGSVLLPDMVRLSGSVGEFQQYVGRWSTIIFVVTIPLAGLFLVASPTLMPILYGKDFADTGKFLAILGLAIPFILNNSLYFHRAITLGATGVFLATFAATAMVGLILSVTLGSNFGATGIACAIVTREVAMFAIFRTLASREALQPA
jgi:O-antigen/teichoic acid export membrane protein